MNRLSITFILSLCFLCSQAYTQDKEPEHILLTTSDVKIFIQSFPSIEAKLEQLDIDYDRENHDFTLPEASEILNEVNDIVTKYGYKDYADFIIKTATIAVTYSSIKLDEESVNAQPEIAEAIEEVEDNEYYTAEQKEQMITALKQSSQILNTMSEDMADPRNVAVVTPYLDKIEEALDIDE